MLTSRARLKACCCVRRPCQVRTNLAEVGLIMTRRVFLCGYVDVRCFTLLKPRGNV